MTDFDGEQHWRANAHQWIRWARKPGHDAYWAYRDQFRDFLPPPGPSTLEIGCGEGRISRDLTAAGHNVTAIDISPELINAAKVARSAQHYHVADAAALPFSNNHFDCVVAYNVLMNVPDLTTVVKESARVLAINGHLVISIVHPFIDRMIFFRTTHRTCLSSATAISLPVVSTRQPRRLALPCTLRAGLAPYRITRKPSPMQAWQSSNCLNRTTHDTIDGATCHSFCGSTRCVAIASRHRYKTVGGGRPSLRTA